MTSGYVTARYEPDDTFMGLHRRRMLKGKFVDSAPVLLDEPPFRFNISKIKGNTDKDNNTYNIHLDKIRSVSKDTAS